MSVDAVVVPLKRFDLAKTRLRGDGATNVSALARQLAVAVIKSSQPRTVIVLSEDPAVTKFADQLGAIAHVTTASNLNEAVSIAYRSLADRFERLIIAHGDLANPRGLATFDPDDGVTIITDHHGRGTNVLALPTGLDFHFAYGPDSRRRHEEEAKRLGVAHRVVANSPWCFDVDTADDAKLFRAQARSG